MRRIVYNFYSQHSLVLVKVIILNCFSLSRIKYKELKQNVCTQMLKLQKIPVITKFGYHSQAQQYAIEKLDQYFFVFETFGKNGG